MGATATLTRTTPSDTALAREKGDALFRVFVAGVAAYLTRVVEATHSRWDL